jgi:ABC-type transporter Mla subunit MlaD
MPRKKPDPPDGDDAVLILRGIWAETKALNARIDRTREDLVAAIQQTNQRIDQTNGRLDQANGRLDQLEQAVESLGRRQTETEVRLASELVAVARAVTEVRDLLRDRLDLRDRVENHELRLVRLEDRLPA